FALAGTVQVNLAEDALGTGKDGQPVYLKEIWPTPQEVAEIVQKHVSSTMFQKSYADVFRGDENWQSLKAPQGDLYRWDPKSTYIKEPQFFEDMTREPAPIPDIRGARVLALLKDSVTTDHIS